MRPLAGVVPVAFLCLMALLLISPATNASESTLVAKLPLMLEGDIQADAHSSLIRVAADPSGTPHMDLFFTAGTARISLVNQTVREGVDCANDVAQLLCEKHGSDSTLTQDALRDVEFLVKRPLDDLLFLVYDGATSGAKVAAHPLEGVTELDVTTQARMISYRDEPVGLDFVREIPDDTMVLSDTGMRYEVRGDFTFVLHGAELTTVTPDRTYIHETGTWESETTAADTRVSGERVTQYVRVEVTDAILTLVSSGGSQELYAPVEEMVVEVDGAIRAEGAAGTLQIGDQDIRSRGDEVRAEGRFTLTPTYVMPGSDKQVVFGVSGEIDTLAVGPVTYLQEDAAIAVAATGLTVLVAGLGAYFWPTAKAGLVAPLYAKLTKDKVLDQGTRSLVHAKVEQDPGCQVKQIADALEISWTTAAYHLRVLCKMGLIVAKRSGRHEHYFVAGTKEAAGHAVVTVLQNATARRIVETVLRQPGIIQKDLCDRLGIAASTASGHLARLRDVGALREEREWKKRRYFAGPALQQVPLHLEATHLGSNNEVPATA